MINKRTFKINCKLLGAIKKKPESSLFCIVEREEALYFKILFFGKTAPERVLNPVQVQ